jgi:hypothetical protein
MKQEKLQQLLDTMGIVYIHTATKPTAQSHPSQGHYNNLGDWIDERIDVQVEPTGIKIKDIPKDKSVCDYCNVIKSPLLHIQCKNNRYRMTGWKVKCQDCKKEIEFQDFKVNIRRSDK